MYSKLGSIICNFILGIIFAWLIAYFYLVFSDVFRSELVDYVAVTCFVLLWLIIYIAYNVSRYRKLQQGVLSYGKATFYLTLFIPLFSVIVIILCVYLIDLIKHPWKR